MKETVPAVIRVLIVEDHQMVGEMIARVLGNEQDITVVDWVKSVGDAERSVASHVIDVVLMDYRLPDGDGVTTAGRIRREYPHTRVVIVTGVEDGHVLKDALQAGCSGYLSKTEGAESLAIAVRAAHAGSTAISPEMLARVIYSADQGPDVDELSVREMDVLRLLAEGMSGDEIAERLTLSRNTVRNHTQNILEKLDVHSKLEAVTKALRSGLVSPPS